LPDTLVSIIGALSNCRAPHAPELKPATVDPDTVQALRNGCVKTLGAFVKANKTRRCFEEIDNASDVSWLCDVLLEQRIGENKAFERYQKARRTLFALTMYGGFHCQSLPGSSGKVARPAQKPPRNECLTT
jgi:hypothetical protein